MENKWHGDLFTNGEKPNGKNPTGWFSGHHSWNSTIITTSGYKQGFPSTLPTYIWTLTPIPNWTCSVDTVSLSDARLPSMWLTVAQIPVRDFKTPIWKIIGCKVLQFIHTMTYVLNMWNTYVLTVRITIFEVLLFFLCYCVLG